MTVRALHHVQVFYPAGEEGRARAFYRDRLGLAEIERLTADSGRAGIWLAAGDGQVHLSADADAALHPRRHFALRVDDFEALVARLRAAGDRFEIVRPAPASPAPGGPPSKANKIELDEIP